MSEASGSARTLPDEPEGWGAFFSRYGDVVLVANSDEVDLAALEAAFGPQTLFVFFNKTYKVLRGAFDRPALLVARSSPAGANIVYRREVGKVVEPFAGPSFAGIMNLRASPKERFSERSEFDGRTVGFLDLSELTEDFYPSGQVATSGFALALWLAERRTGQGIHLAGFSGRRSEKWKLFKDHDWTFEQTALRQLHRAGLLTLVGRARASTPLRRFAERFPEVAASDVEGEAREVIADRLANIENAVDELLSRTRLQAALRRFFRALKPSTRKARMARSAAPARDASNALAKSRGSD